MLNVRSSKGFTLLEMMAVCVILTILAGIIMPNIARRIDYAKMIRTVADIRNLETAVGLYHADTGFYPESVSTEHPTWTSSELLSWRLTGIDPDTNNLDLDIFEDTLWQGSYIKGMKKDSWNSEYVYLQNRFPRDLPPYPNQILGEDYPFDGDGSPKMPASNFDFYLYSKGKDKKTSSDGDLQGYEFPVGGLRYNHSDDINNWDTGSYWMLYY